jgi:MYXO-CTERM domain-containing protein
MTDSEQDQQSHPADPSGIDEPHDVLAAEEFGIPARDNRIPSDPTGLREPHDVLAAEEFAMPAGVERHGEVAPGGFDPRAFLPLALAGLLLLLLLRRRR